MPGLGLAQDADPIREYDDDRNRAVLDYSLIKFFINPGRYLEYFRIRIRGENDIHEPV